MLSRPWGTSASRMTWWQSEKWYVAVAARERGARLSPPPQSTARAIPVANIPATAAGNLLALDAGAAGGGGGGVQRNSAHRHSLGWGEEEAALGRGGNAWLGNTMAVLSTRQVKELAVQAATGGGSGDVVVLQKFIKSSGTHSHIQRTVWRPKRPVYAWAIASEVRLGYDGALSPPAHSTHSHPTVADAVR